MAVTAWQFVLHGSTAVSICLNGRKRTLFQISMAVAFPLALSMYFLRVVPSFAVGELVGQLVSPQYLLPTAIIGYASWFMAEQLDREHPFRGFLMASAAIFVICLLGYHGIQIASDEFSEATYEARDSEKTIEVAQTGRFFGQFLLYILASYAALLAKLWRRHA